MAGVRVDLKRIRTSWEARGFSFGIWTDPPGKVWEDYVHDTDELFLVLDGDVELEMDGRRTRPRAGEEILIPAGTPHTVRNVGAKTSRWLYGYRREA